MVIRHVLTQASTPSALVMNSAGLAGGFYHNVYQMVSSGDVGVV